MAIIKVGIMSDQVVKGTIIKTQIVDRGGWKTWRFNSICDVTPQLTVERAETPGECIPAWLSCLIVLARALMGYSWFVYNIIYYWPMSMLANLMIYKNSILKSSDL